MSLPSTKRRKRSARTGRYQSSRQAERLEDTSTQLDLGPQRAHNAHTDSPALHDQPTVRTQPVHSAVSSRQPGIDILAGMAAEQHERYYLEMSSPTVTPPRTPDVEPFVFASLDDMTPEDHKLYYLSMSSPTHSNHDERQLLPDFATDPSFPHEVGTCFWDKLSTEIKDAVFEMVFVLNDTDEDTSECHWEATKRSNVVAMRLYPLAVCMEWYQTYSRVYYSRALFTFNDASRLRLFALAVDCSIFITKVCLKLDRPSSADPVEAISAYPSLRCLYLDVTARWFRLNVGWDIDAHRWVESDFHHFGHSRALMHSLRGKPELLVQVIFDKSKEWLHVKAQDQPIFDDNMEEFVRIVQAATKLPKLAASKPTRSAGTSPSPKQQIAISGHSNDPSIPREDGTCFWDRLPLELMQSVLELVYPTGQKINPITKTAWINRETKREAVKKRKDRTSGLPFPGPYVESFLGVSKIWFEAASKLFYARANFPVVPQSILFRPPAYMGSLTTISVFVSSHRCATYLEELLDKYPAIARVHLEMSHRFFKDMVEQDLDMQSDTITEADLHRHESSARLLRSVHGISKVSMEPLSSNNWRYRNGQYARHIALLARMAAVSAKLPRAGSKDAFKVPSSAEFRFHALSAALSSSAKTFVGISSSTARLSVPQALQVNDLPATPQAVAALLDTDGPRLLEFFEIHQSALLRLFAQLKSDQAR